MVKGAQSESEIETEQTPLVSIGNARVINDVPKRSESELTQIRLQVNAMNLNIVKEYPDAFIPIEIDQRDVFLLKPLDLTIEDYQKLGLFGDPSDTILFTDMGICIISPFSIDSITSRSKEFSPALREAMDKADYYDLSVQALNMLTEHFFEERSGKNFSSFSGDIKLKHTGQTLNAFIELYNPLERSSDNILIQLASLIRLNQKIHSNENAPF